MINEYLKGYSIEKFKKDRMIQDAVIRRLEIIGEAVKNLPEEAYSFLYGKEAEKAIEDEGRIVSDEAIKERSYRLFRETLHLDIPKSDFLKLRGNLLANISPFSMD